ncbi:MAG: tRNA preQ1(34) S-adenosylmethionine ribosyltransferase-isomerase QueA [Candidatus Eremiobacteraeota bacterium]|nr:tRNA preQ1(34) S-adenosylmethionine ribosyltransferase-isomerase QueA [Candidatus Eremiobacteraeota bacterium]
MGSARNGARRRGCDANRAVLLSANNARKRLICTRDAGATYCVRAWQSVSSLATLEQRIVLERGSQCHPERSGTGERSESSGAESKDGPSWLTAAYDYDLPKELIAHSPAEPRDASRLLVLEKDGRVSHLRFSDFPTLLEPGDLVVLNETRVIRARLNGNREPAGGAAELLLLRPVDFARYDSRARRWFALVRPGRRLRTGARVRFGDDGNATVSGVASDGVREIVLDLRISLEELLERYGEMPLPPYVGSGDETRAARYQTIFAKVPGSVAAPTASLHFTEKTFRALEERGVLVAPIVLDISLATFKPMTAPRIEEHKMHAERYTIPESTAQAIRRVRGGGRRVIAAGTTVVRALESSARDDGTVSPGEAETTLFIAPGFHFRVVDSLLTNFHLPASTLLVLVSAFAGYDRIRSAYEAAIAQRYRFYSFGDAMFVHRTLEES